METDSSLNHSIDEAKKHYSSIFSLPSFKKALLYIVILCFIMSLSVLVILPSQGLIRALFLGFSLFALTIVADLAVTNLILRHDPIFVPRRALALSCFSLLFWLIFIIVSIGLSFSFGWLVWVKLSLLGYAAVVTLRVIVFMTTSDAAIWRRGVSVLLQPTLCLIAFLVFWADVSSAVPLQFLPFIIVSPVIALVAGLFFVYPVRHLAEKTFSLPSIPLFRAFIVDYATGDNAPIEQLLENMGEDKDIEVNVLKFESSKPKAAFIVPLVHPGPFKNVGSSLLPSLLKNGFEKEIGGDACIPLGILGHELDLSSQAQNQKVVSQVIASAKFRPTADLASPFVRVIEGAAGASCQIFGDTALLSFTLAPKTTEDLPQELGRMVSEEAVKLGLKHAVVVNTHNSITDIVDTAEHLGELRVAASKCLQQTFAQPTLKFTVGAASIFPKEFSLKAGMGTGGITAIVVQVGKQKTAYVVIDGNNMISGLREKILAALASAGFDESEVFTTDTHAVVALNPKGRGYHPVGEAMNHEVLIRYICEVAKKAENNSEDSKVACLHLVVPKVRVIGEDRIKSMTTLVDKAIQTLKKVVVPVFGLEGLLLILLLLL